MKKIFALALFVTSTHALAATAFWNGHVRYITTITYQQGVECGYNYGGRNFLMVFTGGSCPNHIEVN